LDFWAYWYFFLQANTLFFISIPNRQFYLPPCQPPYFCLHIKLRIKGKWTTSSAPSRYQQNSNWFYVSAIWDFFSLVWRYFNYLFIRILTNVFTYYPLCPKFTSPKQNLFTSGLDLKNFLCCRNLLTAPISFLGRFRRNALIRQMNVVRQSRPNFQKMIS